MASISDLCAWRTDVKAGARVRSVVLNLVLELQQHGEGRGALSLALAAEGLGLSAAKATGRRRMDRRVAEAVAVQLQQCVGVSICDIDVLEWVQSKSECSMNSRRRGR